jgi:hypothetical protein
MIGERKGKERREIVIVIGRLGFLFLLFFHFWFWFLVLW